MTDAITAIEGHRLGLDEIPVVLLREDASRVWVYRCKTPESEE